MTRTTIDLDPGVLKELRERSRSERKPMGQVASEALARSLGEDRPTAPPPFEWTSRDLGKPLVDLEDKEAVRDILEPS